MLKRTAAALLLLIACAFAEKPATKMDIPHVTAAEAVALWQTHPDTVRILDCRTPEEHALGHPTMAHNIPSQQMVHPWKPGMRLSDLPLNPHFEEEVARRFRRTDVILVLCRAGTRSLAAAKRLKKAGFENVFNIVDGFDGLEELVLEEGEIKTRIRGGWKNTGAPWEAGQDQEEAGHTDRPSGDAVNQRRTPPHVEPQMR